MDNNQTPYILALTKVSGIGPKISKILVSYSGGFEAVFNQSKKALLAIPGIGEYAAKSILEADPIQLVEEELRFLAKQDDIHILPYTDPAFPSRFRNFEDSPLFLYYRGSIPALQANRTVGIIGTRSATQYGKDICENIVRDLSGYGVTIISGLAYGIDSIAHQTSVSEGIPTIGILGHGLDMIYPASNKKLASHMVKDGGLLTEFSPKTQPAREHFPMRNRLVAAMSDAIIVVESPKKGGSMITAELANSYNKDVFAVPGKLSDEKSEGCNLLIKSHKASLYQSAKDIAYIMRWDQEQSTPRQMHMPLDLNQDEMTVFQILKEHESMAIDQMHYKLEIPLSQLSALLLNLEFKGLVRSLPGKKYTLAHK